MRPADARRTCTFHSPDNPAEVCGAPLSGRGRSKWCSSHAALVREAQKKLRNASYQRAWRDRHAPLFQSRREIYREVRQQARIMSFLYPFPIPPRRLHWALLMSLRQISDSTARKCHDILYRSAILPGDYRGVVKLDYEDVRFGSDGHPVHPGDSPCVVSVFFQKASFKRGVPCVLLAKPTALLVHNPVHPLPCEMETIDSDPSKVEWLYRGVCRDCGRSFCGDLLIPWLLQLFWFARAWGWTGRGLAMVSRLPAVASAVRAKDYFLISFPRGGSSECVYTSITNWPLTWEINYTPGKSPLKSLDEWILTSLRSPAFDFCGGQWSRIGHMLLECDQTLLSRLIELKTLLRVSQTAEEMMKILEEQ
jgi:hypothetical protein